jgi:hypothetical protein
MIGFAFNNRLSLGGFAGEPDSPPGGLNPFEDPARGFCRPPARPFGVSQTDPISPSAFFRSHLATGTLLRRTVPAITVARHPDPRADPHFWTA